MTISPPHWIKRHYAQLNHTARYRISLVSGLEWAHQQHHFYGRPDGLVEVDASIAPVVAALNQRGHRTLFSCSGLEVDHADVLPGHPVWGYLLFDSPAPRDLIGDDAGVIGWNGMHLKLPYGDAQARPVWAALATKLGVSLA